MTSDDIQTTELPADSSVDPDAPAVVDPNYIPEPLSPDQIHEQSRIAIEALETENDGYDKQIADLRTAKRLNVDTIKAHKRMLPRKRRARKATDG